MVVCCYDSKHSTHTHTQGIRIPGGILNTQWHHLNVRIIFILYFFFGRESIHNICILRHAKHVRFLTLSVQKLHIWKNTHILTSKQKLNIQWKFIHQHNFSFRPKLERPPILIARVTTQRPSLIKSTAPKRISVWTLMKTYL